jgi:beta-xylosidase
MISRPSFVYPWHPDQGDGTYKNPVLHADYSDPDVIQVGDDFYLISSSFNCTPAIPILHSRDLINWKLINHALKNLPHPRHAEFHEGSGVWAPSLRFHDELFWIFFPMVEDGIYVTTAKDPVGVWSEPHLLLAGKGLIDPCPFWDDDGLAYLVHAYARSRSGLRDKIHVRPMSSDAKEILGEGKIVFEKPETHPYMEGPKVHKKDAYYYIFAPAGGVPQGWQAVLRSRQIYGPYEDKIVLEKGSTSINGPHQGALIELANGEDWFFHFQDAGLYGRIVHLQPVTWKDGWPMMGADFDANGVGEPVEGWRKPHIPGEHPIETPQTSDEFDAPSLGLQWQWNANHEDSWISLSERPGHLRLYSQHKKTADLLHVPSLLLQKLPARAFTVETALEFSPRQADEQAGMLIVGRAHATLCLRQTKEGIHLIFQVANEDQWSIPLAIKTARLRVTVRDGGICSFAYHDDGKWREVPVSFTAEKAEWIGARVGVYSHAPNAGEAGFGDFDYFRFTTPL